jgi:cell wall-associated NlpC family hydrolase
MEKQDVKRMQIVRHLKQQNTATRTAKKRSTTYNTPVRHDSENYQQREIENNSELFPKERPEFSDLDSTSKLSLQQERTNEKYIEPEHPEFYRRIEETSPLEDQLGLVYTDQPQAEPKISYHERDIHNLRLFTQRYILQKEMENFANQAQVQVTSGNVERPQTTGELAGIYENEMRESPSTSQVSRQIETSEMLFSEYTEPAMPDILKRDSFSMQKSYHRNTEDDFTQDNGSNATVWSVSSPKEKIFSPEVSLMHEEQVPAYIPEYKIAEEQTSLQEQRMKNLRLFAQKYAKQIATNQIPSVYLEHQESNSLQMGTPFNINSGVQENFPSREQQEQRAAEDQAEQQRQEILRQNDIYQQTMYRRSEEELFPESERSSVYSDLAFGEKQNPTLSARKYANAVIGNTISVSANVIVSKSETKIPEDASVSENADSLERFKKAARAKKFQAASKKKTDSTGGIKSPNATSTEQILSSDTTSKQDTVMPLTSSEIDGILESWKKDSFNVLRAKSMQEEISGEASDIFKGEKDFSMKSKERSRRSAQAAFFDRENAKKHSASKVDLRARSTSNSNLLEKNSDIIKSPDELRDSDKIQLMQLRRLRTFLYHGKHEPKISTQSDASITRGVESSSVVQGVSDPSKKTPDVLELQEADLNSEPKSNINRAIQEKPSVAGKKSDVKTEGKSDLPNKDNKMTFHRRNYEEDWSIDEEASSEKKKSKPQEKKKKQPNKKTDSKNQEDKKKASQEAASEKQAKNRKAAEKHGKIVTAVKWLQKGQKTKNSIQVFQDTDKQEEKQKRISEQQKLLLKGGTKAFLQVSKALIQLFFGLLPVLFFGAFFSFLFIVIITQNQSASSEYDGACYLAAKYESGGNPDQTGGDGGNACGEFQFDNRYELGPFVRWCHEKDSLTYAAFEPYIGMTTQLKDNTSFYAAWHSICAANKVAFEAAQCEYVYTQTLQPLLTSLTQHYGFDFNNASDALKGCVLSFGNRDGKYVQSLTRYFDGTTASSTDKEIIERAYDAMIARRPSISRWSYEKADCLAQLAGTLDIYAPSENGAGGIDWSWKKSNQTSASGNAAVQAALNAVGSGYSQTRRDDPGWYDCSSLVYRSYAAAGITYLNGKCAAEQAQYLVSHNMTVSYSELQPGDLIFYSYEVNGRYRNISHVAIYVGDGVMVHAANESRGVVKQALSQSNLSPQLYCRPQ